MFPAVNSRTVPENVILQVLKFYSSFVGVDAPVTIPFINSKQRDAISKELVDLFITKKGKVSVFQEIAALALQDLFWFAYNKFIQFKGEGALMKKMGSMQVDWEKSMENDEVSIALNTGSLQERMLALQKLEEEKEGLDDDKPFWDERVPLPQKIWEIIMGIFGVKIIQFQPTKECLVATFFRPRMHKVFLKHLKVFLW